MSDEKLSLDAFLAPKEKIVDVDLPESGKTVKVRTLSRGVARRIANYSEKQKDHPELVDAFLVKEVLLFPDLSDFTVEQVSQQMDRLPVKDVLYLVTTITRESGMTDKFLEDIKNE